MKKKTYILDYVGGPEKENFILKDPDTQEIVYIADDIDELATFLREDCAEPQMDKPDE